MANPEGVTPEDPKTVNTRLRVSALERAMLDEKRTVRAWLHADATIEAKDQAVEDARREFIQTLFEIQSEDVDDLEVLIVMDPAYNKEKVGIRLPVVSPGWRNYETHAFKWLDELEAVEPNVRDLLPEG